MRIEFTETQIEQITQWVQALNKARALSKKTRKLAHDLDRSGKTGIKGEYAAALAFKVPYSFKILNKGDEGHDLRVGLWTVDVKSTSWPTGERYLAFPKKIDFRADMAVLAYSPEFQWWVELLGVISRYRFLRECKPKKLKLQNWVVPASSLTPMDLHLRWSRWSDERYESNRSTG